MRNAVSDRLEAERKLMRFHDELYASLDGLERSVARLRRHTILFGLWGVTMAAATAVRIIAEML